ncbi:hypothetical protein EBU02_03110 [bacterium]|nr:hypothetical protein [bacterium]
MIPFRNLAETRTPDGSRFSLHEHDGEYFLKLNGRQLMGSNLTTSEIMLADLACGYFQSPDRPRILIGGLGLGFSLCRVLEIAGPTAVVVVAELLPEVVAWNREFLSELNGKLLDDPRVKIVTGDVFDCIKKGPGTRPKIHVFTPARALPSFVLHCAPVDVSQSGPPSVNLLF